MTKSVYKSTHQAEKITTRDFLEFVMENGILPVDHNNKQLITRMINPLLDERIVFLNNHDEYILESLSHENRKLLIAMDYMIKSRINIEEIYVNNRECNRKFIRYLTADNTILMIIKQRNITTGIFTTNCKFIPDVILKVSGRLIDRTTEQNRSCYVIIEFRPDEKRPVEGSVFKYYKMILEGKMAFNIKEVIEFDTKGGYIFKNSNKEIEMSENDIIAGLDLELLWNSLYFDPPVNVTRQNINKYTLQSQLNFSDVVNYSRVQKSQKKHFIDLNAKYPNRKLLYGIVLGYRSNNQDNDPRMPFILCHGKKEYYFIPDTVISVESLTGTLKIGSIREKNGKITAVIKTETEEYCLTLSGLFSVDELMRLEGKVISVCDVEMLDNRKKVCYLDNSSYFTFNTGHSVYTQSSVLCPARLYHLERDIASSIRVIKNTPDFMYLLKYDISRNIEYAFFSAGVPVVVGNSVEEIISEIEREGYNYGIIFDVIDHRIIKEWIHPSYFLGQ